MNITHPDYGVVKEADGFFFDPISKSHAKQNLGSDGRSENGDGSWIDFTAPGARKWWAKGVQGLIDLGVDGIWE